jgi:hypothetical protein
MEGLYDIGLDEWILARDPAAGRSIDRAEIVESGSPVEVMGATDKEEKSN